MTHCRKIGPEFKITQETRERKLFSAALVLYLASAVNQPIEKRSDVLGDCGRSQSSWSEDTCTNTGCFSGGCGAAAASWLPPSGEELMRCYKVSAAGGAEASAGKHIISANHQRGRRGWYLCARNKHNYQDYRSFMCDRKRHRWAPLTAGELGGSDDPGPKKLSPAVCLSELRACCCCCCFCCCSTEKRDAELYASSAVAKT